MDSPETSSIAAHFRAKKQRQKAAKAASEAARQGNPKVSKWAIVRSHFLGKGKQWDTVMSSVSTVDATLFKHLVDSRERQISLEKQLQEALSKTEQLAAAEQKIAALEQASETATTDNTEQLAAAQQKIAALEKALKSVTAQHAADTGKAEQLAAAQQKESSLEQKIASLEQALDKATAQHTEDAAKAEQSAAAQQKICALEQALETATTDKTVQFELAQQRVALLQQEIAELKHSQPDTDMEGLTVDNVALRQQVDKLKEQCLQSSQFAWDQLRLRQEAEEEAQDAWHKAAQMANIFHDSVPQKYVNKQEQNKHEEPRHIHRSPSPPARPRTSSSPPGHKQRQFTANTSQ